MNQSDPDPPTLLLSTRTRRVCLLVIGSLLVRGAALLCVVCGFLVARGAEGAPVPEVRSVESIAKQTRQSLAVISHYGRDGEEDGVGSGFVISADGLIATCLHVIDEARPIAVQLADGSQHKVVAVQAWDRKLDLAILRIDAENLVPLELGDSAELNQGAPVVAMGNPLGLEYSVVNGVVSARRDFDGVEMIQLAIPIEPGNSGGPLLDMQGRVHGVLNMKSLLSPNLGFALPINLLKPLIEKPNPVPMDRWLTIGALNPKLWTPHMGARWTQRGGRIRVEGLGTGFGGRALCLAEEAPKGKPFEVAVTVRLDDEAGAAGLTFQSDGDQKHYGFYPSAGRLRLTRFDGPSVYSWKILDEVESPYYRSGDWNRLKVRVDDDGIHCYVNNQLLIHSEDAGLSGGRVGLAKFRNTRATFRQFAFGERLEDPGMPEASVIAGLEEHLDAGDQASDSMLLKQLGEHPLASRQILAERARRLEQRAAGLRGLAVRVHRESVARDLVQELGQPEEEGDLLRAALLVSKLDDPDLDVAFYIGQVDQMASELRGRLPVGGNSEASLEALIRYLFEENGFHGSRTDYYNRANSYLNNVIDDREGLPITLSVLFLELASRVGIGKVSGVSLPGHFVVRHESASGGDRLIDVFEGGKTLGRGEADRMVLGAVGRPLDEQDLRAASKKEIIRRILRNLSGIAQSEESGSDALRYVDLIVALSPTSAVERLDRAMLRIRNGDSSGAKEDLRWILEQQPDGFNLDRVSDLYHSL
jgi:serine protease Do